MMKKNSEAASSQRDLANLGGREEGKASEIEREGDRWSEEEEEMKKNEEGGGGFGLGEWKEMSEISIYIYIRENYN